MSHARRHKEWSGLRLRAFAKRRNMVNTCAKCGRPIEPEMLVVGSEQCAECVYEECRRNGDWEEEE